MIAPHHPVPDLTIAQTPHQPLGHHGVIQPPPHVPGPGPSQVSPESKSPTSFGVKMPKSVDKPRIQQTGKTFSFLRGKTGIGFVGLGVAQVDLGVGHVEVPAEQDGFLGVQAFEEGQEGGVEAEARLEPGQAAPGVGDVGRDHEEGGELGRHHAAVGVVLGVTWGGERGDLGGIWGIGGDWKGLG